jgi:hypothetical protein
MQIARQSRCWGGQIAFYCTRKWAYARAASCPGAQSNAIDVQSCAMNAKWPAPALGSPPVSPGDLVIDPASRRASPWG